MKNSFCVFLFILFASLMHAQCAYTLSGKVIDANDGKPLAFAQIYIKELNLEATADTTGNYSINSICNGTYTVLCQHFGYDSIVTIISIINDTRKNFYPKHHSYELRMVSVVAAKTEEQPTQSLTEIKGRELDEKIGQSLGDALKIITGVSTLQTGTGISKPVIHGMHSNRILILNNGIRQEGQQWGSEHAPEIDPFIANKLIVIKGANSVRYGSDAIAGVILIEPKQLRDSVGIDGELNVVGMSNGRAKIISGRIEQNLKVLPSLSWRLQGTLKQKGNAKTPTYYLNNTGIKEYNFSLTTSFTKLHYGVELFYSQFNTTLGIFSGAHIGNVSDLYDAIQRPKPLEKGTFSYRIGRPFQHIEHELLKAKLYLLTGTAGKLNITYSRQYNLRFEYDKHKPLNNSLAVLKKPELQFEITSHSADLAWEHNSLNYFTGTVGFNAITQGNTYSGRYFIPNFRNYTAGFYWIERYAKGKWHIEGGLRYDYRWLQIFKYEGATIISPIHKYKNSSVTVGLIYKANSKVNFNFNTGNAWRAPGANELYSDGIHHGTASFEIGDKNLKLERALNFILGTNYCTQKLNLKIETYHNVIKGYIYLQAQLPATVTIHGSFPTFVYKQVDANFSGVDVLLSYRLFEELLLTGKASLLRAYNKSLGDWLVQMPSDKITAEATYNFKLYKQLKNNYIKFNMEYNNKQWRVPNNSDYLSPPTAYLLFNMELGTTVHFKKEEIMFGIGCDNLFNTTYRNYMNRFRYYADEIGRNITFRLKIPLNYTPKIKSINKNKNYENTI